MSEPRRRRRSSAPWRWCSPSSSAVGAFGVISAANARTSDVQRIEGLELVAHGAGRSGAENYLLDRLRQPRERRPQRPRLRRHRRHQRSVGPALRHDHDPAPGSRRQRRLARQPAARPVGRTSPVATARTGSTRPTATAPTSSPQRSPRSSASRSTTSSTSTSTASRTSSTPSGARRSASGSPPATRTPASTCSPAATRSTGSQALAVRPQPLLRGVPRRRLADRSALDLGRIERQQNFLQQTADATIDRAAVRSVPRLGADRAPAPRRSGWTRASTRSAAAGTLRKAFSAGLNKYQLPVGGRDQGRQRRAACSTTAPSRSSTTSAGSGRRRRSAPADHGLTSSTPYDSWPS